MNYLCRMRKIYLFFRHFYRRLSRVISFIPIIWRGYDFDYTTAIDLFRYQLNRTADFLDSDRACTVEAKNNAKKIRTATRLLKLTYDDHYAMECFNEMERLYGKSNMEFVPIDDKVGDDALYTILFWYGDTKPTEEELVEIEATEKILSEKSKKKQMKAESLVWRYIGHNIRNWWD